MVICHQFHFMEIIGSTCTVVSCEYLALFLCAVCDVLVPQRNNVNCQYVSAPRSPRHSSPDTHQTGSFVCHCLIVAFFLSQQPLCQSEDTIWYLPPQLKQLTQEPHARVQGYWRTHGDTCHIWGQRRPHVYTKSVNSILHLRQTKLVHRRTASRNEHAHDMSEQ